MSVNRLGGIVKDKYLLPNAPMGTVNGYRFRYYVIPVQLLRIEFDCNVGNHVKTKAAFIRNKFDQRRYLLAKRSESLFKRDKRENGGLPHQINGATRVQMKRHEENQKEEIKKSGKRRQNSRKYVEKNVILPELKVEDNFN
ncbi:hypothetical protein CEXT_550401 [Caerostris extrusa]|uniref:HNH homing endonuclease n=1 Tax=Caerostris extrusa TaxID=172846 RepID=A0AAV4RUF2_CAEEX|nr:hypothetical protein CEXT_550401 [Caerostris extrusa]